MSQSFINGAICYALMYAFFIYQFNYRIPSVAPIGSDSLLTSVLIRASFFFEFTHEMGHLIVGTLMGGRCESVTFGIEVSFDNQGNRILSSPNTRCLVSSGFGLGMLALGPLLVALYAVPALLSTYNWTHTTFAGGVAICNLTIAGLEVFLSALDRIAIFDMAWSLVYLVAGGYCLVRGALMLSGVA